MFRPILKIVCLCFACMIAGYIGAMAEHGNHGALTWSDYIGTAAAHDIDNSESDVIAAKNGSASPASVNHAGHRKTPIYGDE